MACLTHSLEYIVIIRECRVGKIAVNYGNYVTSANHGG